MGNTISIQYKGTAACFDFGCPCGEFSHYCVDMPFSGAVRCGGCEKVWILSHNINVREADETIPDDLWRIESAERRT